MILALKIIASIVGFLIFTGLVGVWLFTIPPNDPVENWDEDEP